MPRVLEYGSSLGSGAAHAVRPSPLDALVRQLVFTSTPERGQVLAVTSATDGEGKTTVAAELALRLSHWLSQKRPVLLLECAGGLSDDSDGLLGRQIKVGPALIYRSLAMLRASGTPLRGATLTTTFETLRQAHSFVVLDLPSLLAEPIAAELTRNADHLYLVIRAGSTRIDAVNQALELVDRHRVDGAILNQAGQELPGWLSRLVS